MALEPSQGMVDQAKMKNIYKEFIIEIMGAEPTSIEEGECEPNIVTGLNRIKPQSKNHSL